MCFKFINLRVRQGISSSQYRTETEYNKTQRPGHHIDVEIKVRHRFPSTRTLRMYPNLHKGIIYQILDKYEYRDTYVRHRIYYGMDINMNVIAALKYTYTFTHMFF